MVDFLIQIGGVLGCSLALLKGVHEVIKTMNSLMDFKMKRNELKKLKAEEGK